ncbi:MAG TPA: flagellar biosynthesis protein FlhF [Sulfurovum sp. UBA12169]|nr:MAG TPA: flagellar biosynthesis protein FlhF [Sulfurovum sp. UBA12169]
MIRKVFKKKSSEKSKIDTFLDKYNLPKTYLSINRKTVTKGVFVGLFWAFIPMPMQMLAVVATTPFVRFNVPIAISMVWLTNPFTMPIVYFIEYLTGNFILGREGIQDIELTVEWFTTHFSDILVPLYVGTAFYSIVISSLIYFLINWLWISSVRKEKDSKILERNEKNPKMKIFRESSQMRSFLADDSSPY